MLEMFIRTLLFEFSNYMLEPGVKSLVDLIPVGECIEVALRDGWITEQSPTSRRFPIKKEKAPVPEVNITYSQHDAPKCFPSIQVPEKAQAWGAIDI